MTVSAIARSAPMTSTALKIVFLISRVIPCALDDADGALPALHGDAEARAVRLVNERRRHVAETHGARLREERVRGLGRERVVGPRERREALAPEGDGRLAFGRDEHGERRS